MSLIQGKHVDQAALATLQASGDKSWFTQGTESNSKLVNGITYLAAISGIGTLILGIQAAYTSYYSPSFDSLVANFAKKEILVIDGSKVKPGTAEAQTKIRENQKARNAAGDLLLGRVEALLNGRSSVEQKKLLKAVQFKLQHAITDAGGVNKNAFKASDQFTELLGKKQVRQLFGDAPNMGGIFKAYQKATKDLAEIGLFDSENSAKKAIKATLHTQLKEVEKRKFEKLLVNIEKGVTLRKAAKEEAVSQSEKLKELAQERAALNLQITAKNKAFQVLGKALKEIQKDQIELQKEAAALAPLPRHASKEERDEYFAEKRRIRDESVKLDDKVIKNEEETAALKVEIENLMKKRGKVSAKINKIRDLFPSVDTNVGEPKHKIPKKLKSDEAAVTAKVTKEAQDEVTFLRKVRKSA